MEPFTLAVPQAQLDDLRQRLQRTRWPDQIAGYGWRQGTERGYLQELVAYWQQGYDWRRQEAQWNEFPQFTTTVAGQRLHLVHARSPHAGARPLLILHGWPGAVYEFYKHIPRLTQPERFGGQAGEAFHVVAPALPGYGFSAAPSAPGATPRRLAAWLHALMVEALGYRRFALQGGDWGSVIASWLALDHPGSVLALHLNMAAMRPALGPGAPPLTAEERAFLERAKAQRSEDLAYQAIQGTRPQTLGYGLHDSPAGLAAWLVEKFRAWSDCGGDVERAISRDEMLTLITWYWVTGSITSSMRLYYEHKHASDALQPGQRVAVPTGFADFPGEVLRAPRSWIERCYALEHWQDMPRGGHFAALEQPQLLAEELWKFFRGR